MIKEPEISFRHVEHSDAIEASIKDRIERLERLFQPITGITVTVDAPHRQHNTGKIYTVDIVLTVPGKELVVNRDPQKDHAHEDLYVVIRDSFDAAERQLKRYAEKQRGEVKKHDIPPHGQVVDIFPEDGYGFIEAADGRRIYFHQNAVAEGDFDELGVGSTVEFVARQGDEGPQASTVKPTTMWKIG